ncbi:mechanosensitive ion channel protein MscS [Henriciella barbarensis]|uniref:Mechanosensitive ion channel protein MscS n=2 Tax=Henriciella barbarensis TaxID=86342 RepID=A0A399QSY0_9PROT|nr:mechanosensitive ion channel protein MscS [Henriciella barbarensis]
MTIASFLARQAMPGAQSAQDGSGDQAGEESNSFVEANIEWEEISEGAMSTFKSFQDSFISMGSLWQLLAVLAALGLGYVGSRYPARRLRAWADERETRDVLTRLANSVAKIVWPAFTVVGLWIATAVFESLGFPNEGLRVAASLMNAWIVVRFVTANMQPGFWQTAIAVIAWTVAALYILHLLDPVVDALNAAAFTVAGVKVTLLRVITSIFIAVVALWLGRIAGDAAQSQLKSNKSLNPSMAGLLGQVLKVGFMAAAIIVAMSTLGINLTALTVFGGALGVGIGFGLQSIFSNFISGIIILFERSVKVGDFIELQSGVTGLVKEINIRSTLVTTNDNVDILVPNEEFIKAQVINWTLRDARRRMRIGFGVAYGTDKELVKTAALEAAEAVPWTFSGIPGREPQVWLVGFGDSSLDFELVVWLTEEAVKKPSRVKADYNWELHTALYKYEIEIPFPQRDINFRNVGEFALLKDGAKVSDSGPKPAPASASPASPTKEEQTGGSSSLSDSDDGDGDAGD